jgi:hypothetical protein
MILGGTGGTGGMPRLIAKSMGGTVGGRLGGTQNFYFFYVTTQSKRTTMRPAKTLYYRKM